LSSVNELIKLEELLQGYQSGFYTEGEVISICLELLYCQSNVDHLWLQMPDWVKTAVIHQLKDFSDEDEIVSFGQKDAQLVKMRLLKVKKWLSKRGLFNQSV